MDVWRVGGIRGGLMKKILFLLFAFAACAFAIPDISLSLNVGENPYTNSSGTYYDVSIHTRNIGQDASPASRTYASGPTQPPFGWRIEVPELTQFGEHTVTLGVQCLEGGQENVLAVWADHLNHIAESDEGNNHAAIAIPACPNPGGDDIGHPTGADLVPVASAPYNYTVRNSMYYLLSANITNEGFERAPASAVRIIGPAGTIKIQVASLQPGESQRISNPVECQESASQVRFVADADDDVLESDEGNNEVSVLVPSCSPQPAADISVSVDVPENLAVMESERVSVTIQNNGTGRGNALHVEVGMLQYGDQFGVYNYDVPALVPGQENRRTFSIKCPNDGGISFVATVEGGESFSRTATADSECILPEPEIQPLPQNESGSGEPANETPQENESQYAKVLLVADGNASHKSSAQSANEAPGLCILGAPLRILAMLFGNG
jgi:subtilase family serine protease